MTNENTGESKPKRRPFYEEFAEKIIEHLKAGTAPWQRPWHPGKTPAGPHNPQSGTVYKGINRVNLALAMMTKDYDDPRWVTLKQANDMRLRVKKGSKAETVIYFQFTKEQERLDENGNSVLGPDGKPEKETILLDRPIMRGAHVFNGKQIDGMPPLELTDKAFAWEPIEKAENILSASGANINHDQSNRAFYRYATDSIHLPPRENFEEPGQYYGTALHELGHWTRHSSRLDRENGPFGSEMYAREELRAEIASWMLGQDIGIPHDPDQHAAYVGSWIEALQKDPYEIVRACRDAEQIKEYVLGLEMQKQLVQEEALTKRAQVPEREEGIAAMEIPARLAKEKTFLLVPYKEKNQAKKLGAKWDKENRSWFAPEGTDLNPLSAWLPEKGNVPNPVSTLSPQEEFAKVIADAGMDLEGKPPVMDGEIHRIRRYDDKPGQISASYCGHADGVPNGWVHDFYTNERTKWVANGHVLSDEQKRIYQRNAEARTQARKEERARLIEETAKTSQVYYDDRSPAGSGHAYLVAKQIYPPRGVKESPSGSELIIPLHNADGDLRSLAFISQDGLKRYQPGGEKKGCFFLIGADPKENAKALGQGEILIAEGMATGATLHEATGKPVAVAFDAGNLEPVAKKLREKFPNAAITICADNDHAHTRSNTNPEPWNKGVELAKKAAQAVGARVKIPTFTTEEKAQGHTDFNDLYLSRRSFEAVRTQIGVNSLKKSRSGQSKEVERGMSL